MISDRTTFEDYIIKRLIVIFVLFSMFFLISIQLFYSFAGIKIMEERGKERVRYIALEEIGYDENKTLLIHKTLEWEGDHMTGTWESHIPDYPCPRIPKPFILNEYLIPFTKCGQCGEFSRMFSMIMDEFEIENELVEGDKGSHAWVEVILDGIRIPVETTELKGYDESKFYSHFNASHFYDCEGVRSWAPITSGGKDVTERYLSWCSNTTISMNIKK